MASCLAAGFSKWCLLLGVVKKELIFVSLHQLVITKRDIQKTGSRNCIIEIIKDFVLL
jgi:hypothetical protein